MRKQTVSLCMIVKDEERCIERCLESISSKVDEIIIVDTGSTDRTLELVKKYNPKVFHYKWDNHFANARNYAIDQAKGDYVLQLDADEWVEDPLEELTKTLDKEIYYISIRNELGGGLTETHKFPRLFRRIPELRYEGALHEQINITKNWSRTSGTLNGTRIHHDGYLAEIKDEKNKHERNLSILLREYQKKPSAFSYYNLGNQYYSVGEFDKALEYYKKSFGYRGEFTFTKRLLVGLIQSLMGLGQYKEAREIASDASQLYPDYVEFKYYEGIILQEIGYLTDAKACFEECIRQGDSDPQVHFSTYEGTGSYLAFARLSEIAHHNFDITTANSYLKQAITRAPNVMGLFKSYLELNKSLNLDDLYDDIQKTWPKKPEILQQLIAALYRLKHPLMLKFVNSYSITVDSKVKAFIDFLKENYKESFLFWENETNIGKEDLREVLLLSLLEKNSLLLNRFKADIPLNEVEKDLLNHLVEHKVFEITDITDNCKDILSTLLADILLLRKFDILEYITEVFTTSELRYLVSKSLYDFGFYEIAFDVLIEGNNTEEQYQVNLLAGKILRQLHQLADSLYYFIEAYKIRQEPEIAFYICNLAIELNDISSLKQILEMMMDWEIESKWVSKHLKSNVN